LPDWLDEHTIIIVEGIVTISNNRPTLLGIRHKALRENLKMYWEGGVEEVHYPSQKNRKNKMPMVF